MATPMTADQFVNTLRAEGLRVVTVGSWRTHDRGTRGDGWGPVNGVMMHHTASSGDASSVRLCVDGYAELPGPLCHGVITSDGTVHVISVGRSNHAGGGDPNVLAAVIDERYNERPPVPRVGNARGVDGNARFYGFECVNAGDGKDPWEPAQVDAMVRAGAAIARAYGWTEKSVIAHREWSSDKPDPAGPGMPSMPVFRARIKERLAHAASWNPGTTPAPPTTGTPVTYTKPDRLLVRRAEDVTLTENVPVTFYWTEEFPDDAEQHGNGGKTVAANRLYNGVLNVRVTGLGRNETIEIYAAEEDANGNRLGNSALVSDVEGRDLGFHPVKRSVPVHGHVTQRLVFEVVSRASGPVVIEEAWLSLHTDPLS